MIPKLVAGVSARAAYRPTVHRAARCRARFDGWRDLFPMVPSARWRTLVGRFRSKGSRFALQRRVALAHPNPYASWRWWSL